MSNNDLAILAAIVNLALIIGVVSILSGIKRELRRQTIIQGWLAQKQGIDSKELNDLLK